MIKNGWHIKYPDEHDINYEYFCNEIAARLDVKVMPFRIKDGTFQSRNFLKRKEDNFVSFKDLLGTWKQPKFAEYVAIILTKTQNIGCVEQFIKMCLFDGVILNDDRHNENMGFIENEYFPTRLAPSFDNHGCLGCYAEYVDKGIPRIKIERELVPNHILYARQAVELGFGYVVRTFYTYLEGVLDVYDHIEANINKEFKNDTKRLLENSLNAYKEKQETIHRFLV